MRISDWSSDVCSSDLHTWQARRGRYRPGGLRQKPVRAEFRRGQADPDGSALGSNLGRDHAVQVAGTANGPNRSEEHTSELQSLMRISYAVFCLKKKNKKTTNKTITTHLH